MFETFFKDLKHSLRMFAQNPAFTLAALAALTLGIGANTAIFSVVNAVLLRPAAFPDPDRVVMFMNTSPQGSAPAASPAKFQHWPAAVVRRAGRLRVQHRASSTTPAANFPEQLRSARVSADFFRLFGAPIASGPDVRAGRRSAAAVRRSPC